MIRLSGYRDVIGCVGLVREPFRPSLQVMGAGRRVVNASLVDATLVWLLVHFVTVFNINIIKKTWMEVFLDWFCIVGHVFVISQPNLVRFSLECS